jgi:hypothetical protein
MSLIETLIVIILSPFAVLAAYAALYTVYAIIKKVIGR